MSNILITGCKGGIALDAAKRLARNGHYIYATVHKNESISDTKAAFLPMKKNVEVFKLDILDEQDRKLIFNLPIDVLINNAAIGNSGPLLDIDIDLIKSVFETNIFSTLALTQLVMKNMLDRGKGKVLFIGSMAGLIPMPFLAPYSITKYALEGLVFAFRQEMKSLGIDVVMINPGSYRTGFNQKNMKNKYEWMNLRNYSNEFLDRITKEEKMLELTELKNTRGIAKQIVKAVQSRKSKKRYVAPLLHWLAVPIVRLFR